MEEEVENQHGLPFGRQGGPEDSVYAVQRLSDDLEDQIALTSRLSVKHVVEVVKKFDDYKRWLVAEIGFEGMLNLPLLGKLDLKMSAWVMRKAKVKTRTIVIDKDRVIMFTPEDFHKNFGVPCGNRAVRGRDGEIKTAAVEFMKQTIGMNASPAHNLKVAEDFLCREISEESSKIEKDCFQISFVIFVMGYVLSPGTKYEHMTIDFWGALANPELISQFNWCEYAVDNLMAGVMKLQSEYHNKAQTVHLTGCHLFFQIFVLDNIDLGIFNMEHSVFPRVQCFQQKKLNQMIIMARCTQRGMITYVPGALRPPDSVCYIRVTASSPVYRDSRLMESSSKHPVSRMFVTPNIQELKGGSHDSTAAKNFFSNPMSATRSIGPSDFSKHLREICKDDPVLEELSLMLKQHNAKCTLSTTLLRNQLQHDMLCFAEKMVAFVKDRCRCCAEKGLSKCITINNDGEDGTSRRRVFEGARKLDMSDDEGPSDARDEENQHRTKRVCMEQSASKGGVAHWEDEDDAHVYNNPVMEKQSITENKMFADRIVVYAQTIAEMVKSLYDNDDVEESNVVLFNSVDAKLPRRKYAMSASFCADPWTQGCLPQPPPIPLTNKFNEWIEGDKDFDLTSVWFLHTVPRILRVNAVCVEQQLVGSNALDHEVATLVLRRFHQLDTGVGGVSRYMLWREVLEPDFATHALAGEKVMYLKSVQRMLACAIHDIMACRMFFAPVVLDQGWAAYMWDMMRKEIHVLDPLCCQVAGVAQCHIMHEEAVSQIHGALFSCLNEYFAKWHCTSEKWKRKFPKITNDIFSRDESGICMMHAIRNYNGVKMMCPLTKTNIVSFRKVVAFEVFRLRDEHGDLVADNVLRAAFDEPEE
ncbi:hypothetical protein VPH35_030892 [Triticum aestivum]